MKPQPTLSCVGRIEKRLIKNSLCHPELAAPLVADEKEAYKGGCSQSISGSSHRQKCATICTVSGKEVLDKVGWAFSPTMKLCWGRNHNLQKAISSASRKATRHVRGDLVPAFTLAEVFLPYYHSPRKVAFTLAEVLITLGIIGVVAAMTLPTLIQNQQEKEKVVRLKKAYSVINSAIQRAITEDGPISSWSGISKSYSTSDDMSDEEKEEITQGRYSSTNAFMSHIKPYLNFIKYCAAGDDSCKVEYDRYSLDGSQFATMSEKSILADGTGIIDVWFYDPSCKSIYGTAKALQNVCGEMFVDIKANNKGRKITGDTVFIFYITEFGLYPIGSAMENQNTSASSPPYNFETHCNISQSNLLNGYGCSAWVLQNENLDYKKCSDLSWSGKRKCK